MGKGLLRNRYLFLLDILLCLVGYSTAILICIPVDRFIWYFIRGIILISGTSLLYGVISYLMNIYRTDWTTAGPLDYLRLLTSCIFCAVVSFVVGSVFRNTFGIYPKLNFAANVFAAMLICGVRFLVRLIYKSIRQSNKQNKKNVLIIGAGNLGVMLLRNLAENSKLNYNVVGIIDDDISKKKMHIYNTQVVGTRKSIIRVCKEKNVDEIIFAIHSIPLKERTEILEMCSEAGVKVTILPGIEESLDSQNLHLKFREIEIEDLLNREAIKLDNNLIENDIRDKVVLVTGGGGSIGSELCRQIIKFKPERLVIVDIYENTTYDVENELRENYPNQELDVLIASVRDKERLSKIFDKYRPHIVFHAAAHKHVPLMEFSPQEAVKNNVFGTYNTVCCADEFGVKRFVLISTDKAVNPTNVMGATKRMCEMIVQTIKKHSKTEFVAVRFGNVLGSNGSVVPRFKKQIKNGGPVTVTHPEITRFFMTIPEAAQLVLQAAAYARGGEIFVLDMGQPVKIYDLARKMISLSGYEPEVDIEIKFTGLREGEKLYEELLMNEEGLLKTSHSRIFVGQPIDLTIEELNEKLSALNTAMHQDEDTVKRVMLDVVPTYTCAAIQEKEEIKEPVMV